MSAASFTILCAIAAAFFSVRAIGSPAVGGPPSTPPLFRLPAEGLAVVELRPADEDGHVEQQDHVRRLEDVALVRLVSLHEPSHHEYVDHGGNLPRRRDQPRAQVLPHGIRALRRALDRHGEEGYDRCSQSSENDGEERGVPGSERQQHRREEDSGGAGTKAKEGPVGPGPVHGGAVRECRGGAAPDQEAGEETDVARGVPRGADESL
eukprot:CAMPEP_0183325110 /NCGR_PEP_ID=MMETSP0160_2-20130417/78775_1 /TAXON_ID=2839 ORGANISM="Odontella Sinensis, Strain Grunow 1884" /NCGR_SAMPLE_ID=MMETSP0160_2 /ASSEMBLY_ACC=CAM_ASM_000250 /LENGTH=207 /DNA_ID=CAMNT_0025492839 /DNA_START=385 /DNA_END=1009 /DNA_ORIENTATION=-